MLQREPLFHLEIDEANEKVGYHNEHHDFPSIPWTRLPELRKIANEFYAPLPYHKSWPAVTWKFITDPSVGMWSRAKRTSKGERLDERVWTTLAMGDEGLEVREEESGLSDGMEEAVGTAYGSDNEEEVSKKGNKCKSD